MWFYLPLGFSGCNFSKTSIYFCWNLVTNNFLFLTSGVEISSQNICHIGNNWSFVGTPYVFYVFLHENSEILSSQVFKMVKKSSQMFEMAKNDPVLINFKKKSA